MQYIVRLLGENKSNSFLLFSVCCGSTGGKKKNLLSPLLLHSWKTGTNKRSADLNNGLKQFTHIYFCILEASSQGVKSGQVVIATRSTGVPMSI